jgi:hypothetical protein
MQLLDLTKLAIDTQLELIAIAELQDHVIDQNLKSVQAGSNGRSQHVYSTPKYDLIISSQTAARIDEL